MDFLKYRNIFSEHNTRNIKKLSETVFFYLASFFFPLVFGYYGRGSSEFFLKKKNQEHQGPNLASWAAYLYHIERCTFSWVGNKSNYVQSCHLKKLHHHRISNNFAKVIVKFVTWKTHNSSSATFSWSKFSSTICTDGRRLGVPRWNGLAFQQRCPKHFWDTNNLQKGVAYPKV